MGKSTKVAYGKDPMVGEAIGVVIALIKQMYSSLKQ